jgi:uncharacterized membrane protein
MAIPQTFLSSEDRELIVYAIREAEKQSPGEILVYFERHCKIDPMGRAVQLFDKLKMNATAERSGILIYVAYIDHVFAIIGDEGINAKVPANFWDETKTVMQDFFQKGKFREGLVEGINLSGGQLSKFFTSGKLDKNEISDDIVMGDE